MGRVVARDVLYKLIFENMFVEPENSVSYETFLESTELDRDNIDYVKNSYIEILKEKENILNIISKSMKEDFSIDRIFKADLAIIVLATYELIYKNIDAKIAINEAVKLAKKYSTDKSFAFVNGVLANIVKDNNLING